MGNICRSPTAQGVFESLLSEAQLADRVQVDSAGTHAYHLGKPPDARAIQAAAGRGIDLTRQRARRVEVDDFTHFDYVLAMDHDNREELLAICPPAQRDKIRLFLEFTDAPAGAEVPDPYYGGALGFERVLDLVEEGARGLLEEIRRRD
jgi:protein-tyrosine phosphatase